MLLPSWKVRLAFLALAFQVVPWGGFQIIARGVHGDPPSIALENERPFALGLLAVSAILSAALGMAATYRLLCEARLRVAVPLILICCVPALLGSALYAHALLVFLTIV